MTKFETPAVQGELRSVGENTEALISLSPEQLETVAGGFSGYGLVATFVGLLKLLFKF
jgi:hypothetical protein